MQQIAERMRCGKNIKPMKPLGLCLLLLFSVGLMAQQPFAPIGARWYDDAGGDSFPVSPQDYILYEAIGDTVIGELTLRQVGPYLIHQNGDSISLWADDSLHLMYDFSVSVGDRVQFSLENTTPFPPIDFIPYVGVVTGDTTVSVDGQMLASITCLISYEDSANLFSQSFTYQYVERIGVIQTRPDAVWRAVVPDGGLYDLIPPQGWYEFFRCYQDADIGYTSDYYATFDLPCDYVEPTNLAKEATTTGWRVYPNPTRGLLRVEGPTRGHELRLFDLTGRELGQWQVTAARYTTLLLPHAGLFWLQWRDRSGQTLHTRAVQRW